jgi:hypothetical protein
VKSTQPHGQSRKQKVEIEKWKTESKNEVGIPRSRPSKAVPEDLRISTFDLLFSAF